MVDENLNISIFTDVSILALSLGMPTQVYSMRRNVSVPMNHPMEPSRMNPAVTTHVPGMLQPNVAATG